MHQEEETTFVSIIPVSQQRSITRAALLAHDGRHAEAEVVRFAAGYHNLKEDHHPNT